MLREIDKLSVCANCQSLSSDSSWPRFLHTYASECERRENAAGFDNAGPTTCHEKMSLFGVGNPFSTPVGQKIGKSTCVFFFFVFIYARRELNYVVRICIFFYEWQLPHLTSIEIAKNLYILQTLYVFSSNFLSF